MAKDAGGPRGVGESRVAEEALAALCHGHPEPSLHDALSVAVKGPSHVARSDVIHPGCEGHQFGLALHHAGAAPHRISQHGPHGAVLHYLQALPMAGEERGEDGGAVLHQGAHRLHLVEAPAPGCVVTFMTFSLLCVLSLRYLS